MTEKERAERRQRAEARVRIQLAQEFTFILQRQKTLLTKDLSHFSQEVRQGVSVENGSMPSSGGNDLADRAFAEIFSPAEICAKNRLKRLRKIEQALGRIKSGTYGICEDCGCLISRRRLLATPIADLCVDCKGKKETLQDRAKNGHGVNRRRLDTFAYA